MALIFNMKTKRVMAIIWQIHSKSRAKSECFRINCGDHLVFNNEAGDTANNYYNTRPATSDLVPPFSTNSGELILRNCLRCKHDIPANFVDLLEITHP